MSAIEEKIQMIVENTPLVYDAGLRDGTSSFWDVFQNYGNRTAYNYGICGIGWTDETFRPKYDLNVSNADRMFNTCGIVNLKECLEKSNVQLNFSGCDTFTQFISNSSIAYFPTLDTSSASNLSYLLYYAASLVWVDKIILSSKGNQTFSATNTFLRCSKLQHAIFEGVIGTNNFDISVATELDSESLSSIINCLADKNGVSGNWTITFNKVHENRISDADKTTASSRKWTVQYTS